MNLVQIEDWREFLKEGEQYFKTACAAAVKRPEVFTPEILYNLTAMAIEKFIMAFLMYHGDLADNHTMADLVEALERHGELPAALREELLFLDSFQEICAIDTYSRRQPTMAEMERILACGQMVKEFVEGWLKR